MVGDITDLIYRLDIISKTSSYIITTKNSNHSNQRFLSLVGPLSISHLGGHLNLNKIHAKDIGINYTGPVTLK